MLSGLKKREADDVRKMLKGLGLKLLFVENETMAARIAMLPRRERPPTVCDDNEALGDRIRCKESAEATQRAVMREMGARGGQVAVILLHQMGHEGRIPDRREASPAIDRGDAGQPRIGRRMAKGT
jgi:hypothetical protein